MLAGDPPGHFDEPGQLRLQVSVMRLLNVVGQLRERQARGVHLGGPGLRGRGRGFQHCRHGWRIELLGRAGRREGPLAPAAVVEAEALEDAGQRGPGGDDVAELGFGGEAGGSGGGHGDWVRPSCPTAAVRALTWVKQPARR